MLKVHENYVYENLRIWDIHYRTFDLDFCECHRTKNLYVCSSTIENVKRQEMLYSSKAGLVSRLDIIEEYIRVNQSAILGNLHYST